MKVSSCLQSSPNARNGGITIVLKQGFALLQRLRYCGEFLGRFFRVQRHLFPWYVFTQKITLHDAEGQNAHLPFHQ